MKLYFLSVLALIILSCETETKKNEGDTFVPKVTKVETLFDKTSFGDEQKYALLAETRICQPFYSDTMPEGVVPCTPEYFEFYTYNHKRDLEDAFMLQVKAGVNDFPFRRLLIFTREKGELVLVNGIIGYLVEKRSRPNEIDDLVVAVFDNLGNGNFDRYDVLIRYEDGKYHFVEAIGDLYGTFKTEELKKRASKMIKERIEEKKLIF
ncbi:MAG: hypothetical protein R3277_09595 [Brumimicrobium sp.]|nr:hypothetical protein [Brumimicrobium sp.]